MKNFENSKMWPGFVRVDSYSGMTEKILRLLPWTGVGVSYRVEEAPRVEYLEYADTCKAQNKTT